MAPSMGRDALRGPQFVTSRVPVFGLRLPLGDQMFLILYSLSPMGRGIKKRVTHFYLYNPLTGNITQPLKAFIAKANADIETNKHRVTI